MALNPFFGREIDPFSPRANKDLDNMTSLVQALLASSASAALRDVDVDETEESFRISIDVPGFKPTDLKVELESGCTCTDCGCRDCSCGSCQCQGSKVVHIHGERGSSMEEGTSKKVVFDKRFTVGSNIDIEKMSANMEHGVLVLDAPKTKAPHSSSRQIEVRGGCS